MDTPNPASIPVEVLPPLPKYQQVNGHSYPVFEGQQAFHQQDSAASTSATAPKSWPGLTFFHPASGIAILVIDFLGFGTELLSGMLDTPVICVLSFLLAFFLVFYIQLAFRAEKWTVALGKAILGATLAGMPVFIGGTMLGIAVVTMSGLPESKVAAARILAEKHLKASRSAGISSR
jgi:RsiW-degrading membrane proteinase PrsW (M82 family)